MLKTNIEWLKKNMGPDLKIWTQMIKEIDQEIIENIAVRMEIADKLAEAKKAAGQIYWDDAKEKEVIQRYMELCEDVNMTEAEAKKIAEVILSISKERQKHFFE